MKSMDILCHGPGGIGKGFKVGWLVVRGLVDLAVHPSLYKVAITSFTHG